MSIALGIIAIVLLVVAFAGVYTNQGTRSNRVVDKVDLESTDKYMTDEVIQAWYGQVGLTNVEEFGTNGKKVSAIIHYKNTTNAKLTLAPSDLGVFMDTAFDYKLKGIRDKKQTFEPGETAEFRVYIKRDAGLDGLTYLVSEPAKKGMGISDDSQIVYRASIDLNMLNTDNEEKSLVYNISKTYDEKEQEDAIGRDKEHVAIINTIDELILTTEEDASVAKEDEERIQKLEQDRQQAIDYLNSINN